MCLNGVISTSKGILPEDINIDSLLNRISEETEEIIIATNPTVEGETTALYLSKLLEKYPVYCNKDCTWSSNGRTFGLCG